MDKLCKGMRFGKLEIVSRDYGREKILKARRNAHQQYLCKCDCGNTKTVDGSYILQNLLFFRKEALCYATKNKNEFNNIT